MPGDTITTTAMILNKFVFKMPYLVLDEIEWSHSFIGTEDKLRRIWNLQLYLRSFPVVVRDEYRLEQFHPTGSTRLGLASTP